MAELYKLDFPNGKSYVGITIKTAKSRLKGHVRSANSGSSCLVHNAIRKYGEPKLQVLAILPREDLLASEVKAIQVFNTIEPAGYNMTAGGDFNPSNVESINKRRTEKSKGRKMTAEHMEKLRLSNVGRTISEETRAKLSAARQGVPKTAEHKAKISAAHKGKTMPKEAVEKMRLALTGRKNPEHAMRMMGNQNSRKNKGV